MAGTARIVGLGMVGNEADVIEAFVKHHARLLDQLVLVVHGPADGTRAILESLAAEGLPLALRDARHAAFRQADETRGVARELLRSGADFIVLCTNTMHKLTDQITAGVNIPFLHIADATAERIIAAGMKKIGLLGTRFTKRFNCLRAGVIKLTRLPYLKCT